MSVLKRFQDQSEVEFLNTAHELEKYTIENTKQIPKSYTFTLKIPLCEAARKINQNIVYANSIYPMRDKADFESLKTARRRFQRTAMIEIQNFLEMLRLASEILAIKGLEEWIGYALKEEAILKAWIKSDAERYG